VAIQPENSKAAIGPRLDEQGRLTDDLHCYSCGYNLRGLAYEGNCTECATAVKDSVFEDKLAYRHPDWLRRLSRGADAIWWSIALAIVLFISFMLGAMFLAAVTAGPLRTAFSLIGTLLAYLATIGVPGLWLLGMIWMTMPDPGTPPETEGASARKLVRGLLIALLVLWPIDYAVGYAGTGAFSEATSNAVILIFCALVLAWLAHIRRLVLRIPDRPTAKACRQLFWFLILLGILTVIEWAGGRWMLFGTRHKEIMAGLSKAMPILNFVGGVYPLVVLDKTSKAFKYVVIEAEKLRANSSMSAD
jgi:hypothetical protein